MSATGPSPTRPERLGKIVNGAKGQKQIWGRPCYLYSSKAGENPLCSAGLKRDFVFCFFLSFFPVHSLESSACFSSLSDLHLADTWAEKQPSDINYRAYRMDSTVLCQPCTP